MVPFDVVMDKMVEAEQHEAAFNTAMDRALSMAEAAWWHENMPFISALEQQLASSVNKISRLTAVAEQSQQVVLQARLI